MNIVCIAWGSLLWKPQALKLASGWHPDGPPLPLEFTRQCDDFPELTLALCEGARLVPTYWAYLATHELDAAREMLRQREEITPERPDFIGSIPAVDGAREDPRVAAWLDELDGDERATAEHYIRRTPAHIDTPYRRLIEARLGWRPLREAHVTQRT